MKWRQRYSVVFLLVHYHYFIKTINKYSSVFSEFLDLQLFCHIRSKKDNMSARQVRMVNVVPVTKIKKEQLSEDEDDPVACVVCHKGFASEVALNNHARVEHINEYISGMDMCQRPTKRARPQKLTKEQEIESKIKTEEFLSSMEPADLTSLASKDVDYIIIKAEDDLEPQKKKIKKDGKTKSVRTVRSSPSKRDKEPTPITGPFECMQPSTQSAEGLCHQIFLSCCEYSLHYRDDHTRRRKGYRCQVCEKPLTGGDVMSPFACLPCGIAFATSKELIEHNQIGHTKVKPYQCEICKKRFTQQGGLQQHMRMHTGERPHACTFCPKAFTQKSGLEQHLRIHTKVRPYRCVICSKVFCQSVHLQQHMRTHTNVAPFQCGICQKRFKQSSHLNYHLKNHNPSNMTDEQRIKYAEIVSLMRNDFVEVSIEHDPQEILIEQGESVPEPEETYVFNDNGETVWCETLAAE